MLCREDGQEEVFQKSISHLSADPVEKDFMLVLDDREEAWDAPSRAHVLKIPALHYFTADSSLGSLPKHTPVDTSLVDVLDVIRDVHSALNRGSQPHVPAALSERRRAVLHGVNIVFSGGERFVSDLRADV